MRSLEDSHWWYGGLRSLVLDRLGDASRILDVGCGTGGMIASMVPRLAVGVDLSPTALSLAKGRKIRRLVRSSACALPFKGGSFDAVTLLDVLYHRDVPEESGVLSEISRVLRPGGVVALHAAAHPWLAGAHDAAVHGARRHDKGRIAAIVESAGFEIVELAYRNLPALPVVVLGRLVSRNAAKGDECYARSRLRPVPKWLNAAAICVALWENRIVGRFPIPTGLSVWCLARKP